MVKKISFSLLAILAILFSLMPFAFYFYDITFGIINTKSLEVLSNLTWKITFHIHIISAGIALSIGWILFVPKIRNKYMSFHKIIGNTYFISAIISSLASIFISLYDTGGKIQIIGFTILGIIWFYTTLMGFFYIKCEEFKLHQKMTVFSYSACFSGVTLRIWLPLLELIFDDFNTTYATVAWLCWIPNLIVAFIINNSLHNKYVE